ncbi:IS5 family transposase [Aurantiacibacter zhengii]|uniref:IS5 family transposase n=1 Tax=Aurantiacibacter zhengii TaxID=2307003 RepID=UPI001F43A3D8|nr:IS5 family transposase [Aurantiacibacter zhengii]
MLKVGCRWCDCPVDNGPSTKIYNPFNCCRRGFWLKLLDVLIDAGAVTWQHGYRQHLYQGAALGVWRKRGRRDQTIGRSRGGWTTKVHALTDVIGRPYSLMLMLGNISDVTAAPALLEHAGRMRYLLGDKGYDADRLRRSLREAGAIPVIPSRRNRKRTVRYHKQRHRERHLVENAFCRLKDFRRVATRYDKLAAKFLSAWRSP